MKYVLIVAWVSFAGLVAFADVTWHHNETVTVDADINDDIYLEGTVYVKVVGGTRCLTGVIREVPGKVGKIVVVQGKLQFRKQGVGPAENEPANEYSGGVEVRGSGSVATRGTASATSSTPEKAMPFGTGLLLCDRSGAGYPMLEWMGTIANDVLCTGARRSATSRGARSACLKARRSGSRASALTACRFLTATIRRQRSVIRSRTT